MKTDIERKLKVSDRISIFLSIICLLALFVIGFLGDQFLATLFIVFGLSVQFYMIRKNAYERGAKINRSDQVDVQIPI